MGRWRNSVVVGLLLAVVACERPSIGDAYYAHENCRRVELVDNNTGEPVIGAEDIAIDLANNRVLVSAYDRLAVERAVRRRSNEIPNGGIYALHFEALFNKEIIVHGVTSLADPADFIGGLRPHGITFDVGANEIVFVNRSYHRDPNRQWSLTPSLTRIGPNGEAFVGANAATACSANDIIIDNGEPLSSFDHGSCDWRASLENVFRLKRSGVAGPNGEHIYSGVAYANGIAKRNEGEFALAATREKTVLFLKRTSNKLVESFRINTPGGPDNISVSLDGGIIAALHPAMFRLVLNRKFGVGKAPSRIVKIDPVSRAVSVLFEDWSGDVFSAATVGVETPHGLVIGSVSDRGVLACQAAP